jgi:UV excision repair protein RAD23
VSAPAPASVNTTASAAPPTPVAAPPAVTAAAVPPPAPVAATGPSQFESPEAIAGLVAMGFPEAETRAALNAAMGNPDLAYEFLLTGIPQTRAAPRQAPVTSAPQRTTAAPGGATGIEQLRLHPQFNMLKQLIQSNPASLAQVLDLIGQQSPELLAAIHANNDAFVAMMNEPIGAAPPPAVTAPPAQPQQQQLPAGGGMPDPAQMVQMLASMPAPQRAAFAQTLGMTPEQLEGFMQMMAQIPPGELQQMLGSMPGGMMAGGAGGDGPGVIRLTEEEMASVNRLMALGFSQQQAAQAYLACDKNEAIAANLLLEGGWDDGDFGDGGGDGGDDGDDMYR